MASETSADCIIVGGGIGGAVLALALGQRGFRVMVFEKELAPQGTARPEVLAKSTMEIFDSLGVGARMRGQAVLPLKGLELFGPGSRPLFHLSQEDFDAAKQQPYSTDPGLTRKILLETAHDHNHVQLVRGIEVQELLRENGRVLGVRTKQGNEIKTWESKLVIGDDGSRSTVRTALGIPLKTREFAADFLAAVGPALPGHKPGIGQAYVAPGHVSDGIIGGIFMPLPQERTALAFIMRPPVLQRFLKGPASNFYDAAAQLSPRCEKLVQYHLFPEGFGHFRRPFGHAAGYVADGAAILGDAAHPVTPAGGQGANASVADAMALANVAADALHSGDCSATKLSTYEKIRRPANQHSLMFSIRANWALRTLRVAPFLAPLLLDYLSRLDRAPQTKQRFIQAVSKSFRTR